MKSKLVLIEGLPSSGKSTAAKMVNNILNYKSVKNMLFLEGNLDHPADYEGVAFFIEEEYQKLINSNKEFKKEIEFITTNNDLGYFVEYIKGKHVLKLNFSDNLMKEFFIKDIYELPFDLYRKLIIKKWECFVENVKGEDKVYIFECPYIQNPITVSLIRDNLDKSIAFKFIEDITAIIKDLNPILIYIKQNNIEKSFRKVIETRDKGWLDFFIDYYTNRGYGKANNFANLEGAIKVLKDRQVIEEELVDQLNINKYIIDNSLFDKDKLYNEIKTVLENN